MRLLKSLALLILFPGIVYALFQSLVIISRQDELWILLAIGFFAGGVIDSILKRHAPGFEVFEHELTHAIAAILFFRRIEKFVVTHSQGHVRYSGGRGGVFADHFIGMAPYILPTFSMFLVLIRPLLGAESFSWYDILIGTTLGFHTLSTIREFQEAWRKDYFSSLSGNMVQTDLGRVGLVYSAIYISVLTAAIHGLLFFIIIAGYPGVVLWWTVFWSTTVNFASFLPGIAESLLGWLGELTG